MISRQLVTVSFKSEKSEQIKNNVAKTTGYESPKAIAVGTAQELLQGSWCSGYSDSWGAYYYRTY